MIRKIVSVSATVLAAGAIAFAPVAAAAVTSSPAFVPVSADVAPTADVTEVTPALTNTWSGATAQLVPFSVLVNTNSTAGYSFTFTTSHGANFNLIGNVTAVVVPYAITGTGADGTTYTNGTLGTFAYVGPTPIDGVTSTFNVNLPVQASVPADAYLDSLSVTVTTLDLG